MAFLTETEKTALIATIKHAESKTHAEIVTVIAKQSDGYRYIPMLWAALIALSIPGLYHLWIALTTGGWTAQGSYAVWETWLYPFQVLIFLGLGAIFQLTRLGLWLIPASVKQQRASRHAREQFFLQKLHETRGRTGILIFVSVAEHYVEIIVDSGIADVVSNQVWDQSVREFIIHLRNGDIAKGFDNTIEHCRTVTWEHFPAPHGRPDELPNHLIEV